MLNREEIFDKMKKKLSSFKPGENDENIKPYLLKNEEFRKVHKVNNFGEYCYYISNYGRVLVVKGCKEALEKQDKINNDTQLSQYNCKIIPVDNGYLIGNGIDNIPLCTLTNVYDFMMEAGWLDDTEDKKLAEEIVKQNIANNYDSNDRIELHHIDNNPSHNSLENLIWVPRSIHKTLPKS